MLVSQIDLANRVARRYRQSQARTQDDPHDHATTWMIPPRQQGIPDDVIIEHSDGCTVTTRDVEAAISKKLDVIAGSCRFNEVRAVDESNSVRFHVLTKSGQRVRGIVTLNVVAHAHELNAFAIIELDLDSV